MLATHFPGKLEQKVKLVSAMKLVTDQESSQFQYVRGTLVTFVLVLYTGDIKQQNSCHICLSGIISQLRIIIPWKYYPKSCRRQYFLCRLKVL